MADPALTRRELFARGAALPLAALVGGLAARARSQTAPIAPPPVAPSPIAPAPAEPLFRLSLAEWSYHRALQSGQMQHLDFPAAAKKHGLEGCEYVNSFFKDKAQDRKYLRELTTRCDDAGVRSLLIMCDGEGELAAAEESERKQAIEKHLHWIEAASFLGCHSIRVNLYGAGSAEELAPRAADSLHRLGDLADDYGLNVLVENHGGPSSNGAWLADVMKRAAHPRVGTLPDFGNFNLGDGKSYDRYKGVEELMPFAKAVSAKSYDFDTAGNETTIDYGRMLKVVLAAGYRAWLGIEYEGERLGEPEGVNATKALCERVRAEMAAR
jgi:L-ribulose-5-phosphate 3-epimerase